MGFALALSRRRRRRRRRPRGWAEWVRIVGWAVSACATAGCVRDGSLWTVLGMCAAVFYWVDAPPWLRVGPSPADMWLSPLGAGTLLRRWLVGDPE